MNQADLDNFLSNKKYALSAVFAEKISGNGYARKEFVAKADWFFGNGTLEHNNGTLGGMPVDITIIREKRKVSVCSGCCPALSRGPNNNSLIILVPTKCFHVSCRW